MSSCSHLSLPHLVAFVPHPYKRPYKHHWWWWIQHLQKSPESPQYDFELWCLIASLLYVCYRILTLLGKIIRTADCKWCFRVYSPSKLSNRCCFWERMKGLLTCVLLSELNETIISLQQRVLAYIMIPQCHTCPLLHSLTINVLRWWRLHYKTLLCMPVRLFRKVHVCICMWVSVFMSAHFFVSYSQEFSLSFYCSLKHSPLWKCFLIGAFHHFIPRASYRFQNKI